MAARTLKKFQLSAMSAGTNTDIMAVVPAGRAFVISKLIVTNQTGGSITATVTVNGSGAPIIYTLPLSAGENYAESGIVLVAGDKMIANISVLNGAAIHVFGEEVDN